MEQVIGSHPTNILHLRRLKKAGDSSEKIGLERYVIIQVAQQTALGGIQANIPLARQSLLGLGQYYVTGSSGATEKLSHRFTCGRYPFIAVHDQHLKIPVRLVLKGFQ